MKAAVIGGGCWGSAFARYLGSMDIPTRLWIREEDVYREAVRSRENTLFLPGYAFPPAVEFSSDLRETASFGDVLFFAVPSQFCRAVYAKVAPVLRKDQVAVSLTKGFDKKTLMRMSQVMGSIWLLSFSPATASRSCKPPNGCQPGRYMRPRRFQCWDSIRPRKLSSPRGSCCVPSSALLSGCH